MNVYFKGEESVCINHTKLLVKDIGEVYCTSPQMAYEVENIELFHFSKGKNGKEVFSVLNILVKTFSFSEELDKIKFVNSP